MGFHTLSNLGHRGESGGARPLEAFSHWIRWTEVVGELGLHEQSREVALQYGHPSRCHLL
jgi:hypothetical protein